MRSEAAPTRGPGPDGPGPGVARTTPRAGGAGTTGGNATSLSAKPTFIQRDCTIIPAERRLPPAQRALPRPALPGRLTLRPTTCRSLRPPHWAGSPRPGPRSAAATAAAEGGGAARPRVPRVRSRPGWAGARVSAPAGPLAGLPRGRCSVAGGVRGRPARALPSDSGRRRRLSGLPFPRARRARPRRGRQGRRARRRRRSA